MRNHSLLPSSLRRKTVLWIACVAVLAFRAPELRAQCSVEDDPDSFNCQLRQVSPLSSTTPSPASLSIQEQFAQKTPRAELSTEASAHDGLPLGSNSTQQAARDRSNAFGQQGNLTEPPNEFQHFVAATTGRMLPIYGASLFTQRPASFGAFEQAPAPPDMAVGTGDELRIRIWGQVDFSANLRVSREGEIYLPKAGAVHVAGLPFSSVAGHLRTALERVYRNFELSVDMGEIHSIQVYVTGQARQPGEYTVSALATLVDAVFLSGGPSSAGSMRHVALKRAGNTITDFDLYALLVKGDKSGDAQLQAGDVLFIPAAGPQVALLGSVRLAAIFELRGEESIKELLDTAGGRSAVASGARLSIERIENHAERRAFELNADEAGLAAQLNDGDIVRIDPIISSYRETVTLRGSLANPGRFFWHAGMRLSDLMPDKDSLVSRDYWWRRTQLGLPAPEFVAPLSVPDQSSAVAQKAANTPSSGAASALSAIESGKRMGAETALLSPAFQTDWNYAVIERMDPVTMATSLIPFDLGKLVLGHDVSQDQELQPGDMVTIFSQDDIPQPVDRQTKYVRLEGEFVHAGVYSVLPDETLRSLVERAGGLTEKAYLYGSEFTRKSTQAIEQQRLNEYAIRLEHQLARSSVSMASTGGASQGEGQQRQVATLNSELIERLRQLQPNGRIVLNLRPASTGENELPETQLEDGDKLVVPPTPATVQVMGAVLNQNAFLYRNGARASDYLRLAGGPNRDADRKQTYVLRADGSVSGQTAGQSIFSSGYDNVRLYPGDTIVVPEKSFSSGAMRGFLAWSQIISQLGLGAAAINELK